MMEELLQFTCNQCGANFEAAHLEEEDRNQALCTLCWRNLVIASHPGLLKKEELNA